MNTQEREAFWKTLCSLSGNDPERDLEKLRTTIKTPKFLYRYRPVDLNSLEALRSNKLYLSTANHYDDPFDTFLHIDTESIRGEFLRAFKTAESTEAVAKGARSVFEEILTEEQKAQLTADNLTKMLSNGLAEELLAFALALRDDVKKDIWSVCFSENGFNETLWLKYADRHKGFVQIYDLENADHFLCGRLEKCENCGIKRFGTNIYPVYYSDEPYDATEFVKLVIVHKLEELLGTPIPQRSYAGMRNGMWERERTTLIKKKCHEYDEEWRMIVGGPMSPPVMMKWIPSGIILGLRMGETEKKLVVSMAQNAGIKDIYRTYIDAQNRLSAMPI